jgi:hypothetical protein
LDELMMDEALTALRPEVSELLEDYLQKLPGGQERMRRWRDTAQSARNAMSSTAIIEVPPFPRQKVHRMKVYRRVGAIMAVAAAIIFGIGIGRYWQKPVVGGKSVAMAPVVPVVAGKGDFWSSRRLMASTDTHREPRRSTWQWNSVSQQPTAGELR